MIHHLNIVDISKLMIKFTHIIDIDEDTYQKWKLDCARIRVGCDSLAAIPSQFNAVLGCQFCAIRLRITHNHRMNRSSSVGSKDIAITDKIGGSDQPLTGMVTLPAGNRRSVTWKRVGSTSKTKKGTATIAMPINETGHDKTQFEEGIQITFRVGGEKRKN